MLVSHLAWLLRWVAPSNDLSANRADRGWRNNASVCPLDRLNLEGGVGAGTTNYTGRAMPAAAKEIAAAAGPRPRA